MTVPPALTFNVPPFRTVTPLLVVKYPTSNVWPLVTVVICVPSLHQFTAKRHRRACTTSHFHRQQVVRQPFAFSFITRSLLE
jgi:hypothetical protein